MPVTQIRRNKLEVLIRWAAGPCGVLGSPLRPSNPPTFRTTQWEKEWKRSRGQGRLILFAFASPFAAVIRWQAAIKELRYGRAVRACRARINRINRRTTPSFYLAVRPAQRNFRTLQIRPKSRLVARDAVPTNSSRCLNFVSAGKLNLSKVNELDNEIHPLHNFEIVYDSRRILWQFIVASILCFAFVCPSLCISPRVYV